MLSRNDAWYIKSKVLHTENYRKEYTKALLGFVKPEDMVIDVACGTGFPSFDLYEAGVKNITCVDADAETLEKYREEFKDRNIPTTAGLWQELPSHIHDIYDVLLCTDNSLVYLDSWAGDENLAKSKEEIMERVRHVVTNFYNAVKPGGKVVIAIAKNIDQKNNYIKDTSDIEYEGKSIKLERVQELDWNNRIKSAINKFFVGGVEDTTVVYKSYLITKQELTDILKEIGFSKIEEVSTSPVLYDDLIIGYK